ncbi:MAG: tetratricopeptide repeat protein, partial [Myxococcota bacterium]
RAEASQGQWDKAVAHVDQALALQPADREALSLRCRLRVVQGNSESALTDCKALQEIAPEDRAVKLRVAGLLARANRLDEASALVSEVAKSVPDHPAVQFRRDQVEARRGNKEALKRIAILAERRATDPEIWWEVHTLASQSKKRSLVQKAKSELQKLGLTVK